MRPLEKEILMKKHGLAKVGQFIGNISAGRISDLQSDRRELANWNLSPESKWFFKNVNIVDVDNGKIYEEGAILVDGNRFGERLRKDEVKELSKRPEIEQIIDGKGLFLIPGMSDLHCHLSLISEYEMTMKGLYYFDAQRIKNCEYALGKGCTTVRDSAGAYDMIYRLKEEIDNNRLLGPRIFPSYTVLTPPGGMWDVNPFVNKMAEMVFGGKLIDFPKNMEDIKRHINEVVAWGAHSIKMYLEEKPLYGGKENTVYNMFTDEQVEYIRNLADEHGKIVESHAMFINGARKAIRGKVNSIAHMTVDKSYSAEDAETMAQNNVAIVPTLGVGSYLAMDCGSSGFPQHPEYKFFRDMLTKYVKPNMESATIPQLRASYLRFYDFIQSEIEDRKMPSVGRVYPERCHGFGVCAPKSFENFKNAGTKVGVGTDGGTGTCFTGAFEIEFESFLRYGYSLKEIVRMVTLGNMEILKTNDQLGSISKGKLADMVLIRENPFENIMSMASPVMVFKEGRCYIDNNK
jgi:imidazolonepropionase-like amidohydrolase